MKERTYKSLIAKNADELLRKALEIWSREENLDVDEYDLFNGIGQDPVIRLWMTALAHQTNLVKEEIRSLKENLFDELAGRLTPLHMTRAIPAFSVMQTAKADSSETDTFVSEETPFRVEKKKEIGKSKSGDTIQFIPLLKTRIVDARIDEIFKLQNNKWQVKVHFADVPASFEGLSFYFPSNRVLELNVSINGYKLPVIGPDEYHKLPFTKWFDTENVLFNESLLYGTTESWHEILTAHPLSLFYIGEYPTGESGFSAPDKKMDFVLEMKTSDSDISLTVRDLLFNCFPVVNVEKHSVYLTPEKPIAKIAAEPEFEFGSPAETGNRESHYKQFLHLLYSQEGNYKKNDFLLRRMGTERYNKNELLTQLDSIVNRYVSDYYAFKDIEGLKNGEKMQKLNQALKEVVEAAMKEDHPHYGYYLILNLDKTLTIKPKSVEVHFLLTDGKKANGIFAANSILPVSFLDKKKTQLLFETTGGRDEVTNRESKRVISQYYNQTRDRLYSKADLKAFCKKELLLHYNVEAAQIRCVDFHSPFISENRTEKESLIMEITLDSTVNSDRLQGLADILEKKINLRSMSSLPLKIKIHYET